jgi:hypothetical protein
VNWCGGCYQVASSLLALLLALDPLCFFCLLKKIDCPITYQSIAPNAFLEAILASLGPLMTEKDDFEILKKR